MSGSVGVLGYYKTHQRLGLPGLKTSPIIGENLRVKIELPESARGFKGHILPPESAETNMLPADTSLAKMCYTNVFGSQVYCCAVLMGTDRTSIHKPEYCLRGQGFTIDESRTEMTAVRIEKPEPVDLPVIKIIASKDVTLNGKQVQQSCVFVYWLVCADDVTASRTRMGLEMSKHMFRTGELQRWGYIFYLAPCIPGREDAAYAQIREVINATLPEYQLTWPPGAVRSAR